MKNQIVFDEGRKSMHARDVQCVLGEADLIQLISSTEKQVFILNQRLDLWKAQLDRINQRKQLVLFPVGISS